LIERLATLRYLRFLAAVVSLTPVTPMALAAQAELDTVVVHAVNAGEPLLKLMTEVASLAKGAFLPADAEAMQKQAWEASTSMAEIVDRQLERSYRLSGPGSESKACGDGDPFAEHVPLFVRCADRSCR